MELTEREKEILKAVISINADDAARGDFDMGLVEQNYIANPPTAAELRELANKLR